MMSDQPISNEELTMLEAATKAAMQYLDRLAVVVDPDIMRRLIAEVRSGRAKERPPIKHSILKQVADRGDDHFSMGIITGFLAEYERLGLVQRVNDGSAWSLTDAGRKHLETTFDTSENYWSW